MKCCRQGITLAAASRILAVPSDEPDLINA